MTWLRLAALLALSVLFGASMAFAQAPAATPPPPPTSAFERARAPAPAPVHGLAPMPDDAQVPPGWLPPGSDTPDDGPSDVIYPPQRITLRFNHKLHLTKLEGATCRTCHEAAYTSTASGDRLLPRVAKCDGCHGSDHSTLSQVKPGPDESGTCNYCHVGWSAKDGNRVAPLALPPPNLVFNHQKHLTRNIGCPQCHGNVAELELATRDQLPRMRGCFKCHQMPDAAARGEAKSECTTCHIKAEAADPKSGRMRVGFPNGQLYPPRWLHNAAHTPDWIERHKMVAANDSPFCGNCHKEEFCVECHDGRVRPRSIHPGDYLNMHAIEARMAAQKCQSCHREQSFCVGCHQRVGVSMTGPTAARESGRFHPPKSLWSDPPRKPGSHAQEAQRNLNACVSCHVERDCVICHGGSGIGAGFNPHRAGFTSSCSTQMRRNPRPCLVCHDPGSAVLDRCR